MVGTYVVKNGPDLVLSEMLGFKHLCNLYVATNKLLTMQLRYHIWLNLMIQV